MGNYQTNAIDVIPVDWLCKTILMAATTADCTFERIPVFHSCTSSFARLPIDVLFHSYGKYWQSANPPPRGRISTDIRAHMYSIQDFESRFRQRFSEELVLALKKNEEDLRRLLANAYRIPRLYGKMYKYDCHFSAANTLALDKAAPAVLCGDMSLGIDWPEYLHKGNMGIHKHILKETVDRRVVVDYTWESIQRQYKPTERSVVSNGSDDSPTKSRL